MATRNIKHPDTPIGFDDFPAIITPVLQHVEDIMPDAIIAIDRGARLFAHALSVGWRLAHRSNHLPTHTGKIEFCRVSHAEMSESDIKQAVAAVIKRALPVLHPADRHLKVLLLEDWIRTGATVRLFRNHANEITSNTLDFSLATLCGIRVDFMPHVVGLPERTTINSVWNDFPEYIGVQYDATAPAVPITIHDPAAAEARTRIATYLINQQFSAAA